MSKQWTLHIDTDAYSGNFERIIFAFLTGIKIEAENGFIKRARQCAEDAYDMDSNDESPYWSLVEERVVEHDGEPYFSHVTISTKKGDSEPRTIDIFLQRRPTDEEIRAIKARLARYKRCRPRIVREFDDMFQFNVLGLRLSQSERKEELEEIPL